MGTNMVSSTATGMGVIIGNLTNFGTIGKAILSKRAETSFNKGIKKVRWILIRFMLIMVLLLFFINGLTKGN